MSLNEDVFSLIFTRKRSVKDDKYIFDCFLLAIFILFSLFTSFIYINFNLNKQIITDMLNILINIYSILIGFSISAYSIYTGSFNDDLINYLSQKSKDESFSVYELTTLIFSEYLVLFIFTLIYLFSCYFVINFIAPIITTKSEYFFNCFVVLFFYFLFVFFSFCLSSIKTIISNMHTISLAKSIYLQRTCSEAQKVYHEV